MQEIEALNFFMKNLLFDKYRDVDTSKITKEQIDKIIHPYQVLIYHLTNKSLKENSSDILSMKHLIDEIKQENNLLLNEGI